jgi:hypothetical protein
MASKRPGEDDNGHGAEAKEAENGDRPEAKKAKTVRRYSRDSNTYLNNKLKRVLLNTGCPRRHPVVLGGHRLGRGGQENWSTAQEQKHHLDPEASRRFGRREGNAVSPLVPLRTCPSQSVSLQIEYVSSGPCSVHILAVTDEGKVYGWGRNEKGQLGLGHTNDKKCPTLVRRSHVRRALLCSGVDPNHLLYSRLRGSADTASSKSPPEGITPCFSPVRSFY